MEATQKRHRNAVLVLTFLSYMSYHATRKVPSIVKTVLHPLSSNGKPTYNKVTKPGWHPFNDDVDPFRVALDGYDVSSAGVEKVNGDYDCQNKTDAGACIDFKNAKQVKAWPVPSCAVTCLH